mmetsp:Transcript_549/g.1626  ORF Transcript_549/g.1626 Transcript_549/m.1626 type:complete len:287 (-) Transcript_549:360-1220(-)
MVTIRGSDRRCPNSWQVFRYTGVLMNTTPRMSTPTNAPRITFTEDSLPARTTGFRGLPPSPFPTTDGPSNASEEDAELGFFPDTPVTALIPSASVFSTCRIVHSNSVPSATPASAAEAGAISTMSRDIFRAKYADATAYVAKKIPASPPNRLSPNPKGKVTATSPRLYQNVPAEPCECSATESTSGFPVLVCFTNSDATRGENGAKYPARNPTAAASTADAAHAANTPTFSRAAASAPCPRTRDTATHPASTCSTQNRASAPSCSSDLSGPQPTTGTCTASAVPTA